MRRLAPWALVLLIGVGAGLGAVLGATHSSGTSGTTSTAAAQWVAGVLATTKAAGTARLDYSADTTSPNPVLRGSATGGGVVDFAAGTFRFSEVQHHNDWTTGPQGQIQPHAVTLAIGSIAVGPAVYLNLGPDEGAGWSKVSIPRDRSGLGLGSAADAASALSWIGAPFTVRSVRDLGPAQVGGVAATRYVVQTQAPQGCTVASTKTRTPRRNTTVWVDGAGRLVQAQNAEYNSGTLPAAAVKADPILAGRPVGSTTQHNTLRLSAFGQPVHVALPALVGQASSSSVAVLRTCAS